MEKIAIIGYSCLFPGAKNPEEFWQNLINNRDSTSSITSEEMGIDPNIFYHPKKGEADKIYSLKGAFIRNFEFDSNGYSLPGEFLESLDDTFKWSLQVAKQALQHSGYLNQTSLLAKCGVILGTLSLPTKSSNQLFAPIYEQVLGSALKELLQDENFNLASVEKLKRPESLNSTSNSNSNLNSNSNYNAMVSGLPAAIVAQALSLSDIHFSLDAACSSPLYATKLASHYLWTHKADLMIAGGISCADPLFLRMLFSGIQGYPENDFSRPLDKNSRGLATADGVGMVVLKRHSDAIRDGDRIYGVICGNGLSNDGKGKHLLSPNSKGQELAFERAYQEAQLDPKSIDYLECHATGTLLGDTTECNSVENFFGKHQASPLIGSVKSNVGHLLTAAASVSLIKVLLSMSKGVIPATINIDQPMGEENQVISPQSIVTSNTNWSESRSVKRAGISAFGLGGTNAHMILEQGNSETLVNGEEPLKLAKMAIVGMDTFFGGCDGLDAFERSIYEGKQHFVPLPPKRWHGVENQTELLKKYNFPQGKAPMGAYIEDFEIDTVSSKIPPNELDKLNQQQLLLLKVAQRALKDADINPGSNVAVLIASETELSVHQLQQRWNLAWEIKEGLIAGEISLDTDKINQLETIIKDGIHNPVDSSEYVSYIANIMASRISALWDFTAPTFTISAGENSTFKVLEVAQHLLTTGEADAVLVGAVDLAGGLENVLLRNQQAKVNDNVNTCSFDTKATGWIVGEGAGAVVLKRHEIAKQENQRIYALIDAISFAQQHPQENLVTDKNLLTDKNPETVQQVCEKACNLAGITPSQVEYLEVFASGIPEADQAEITGLIGAYPKVGNELTCAIGTVKANIGHTYVASGIASLIKTALCLYYRYIPAIPKWSGVKEEKIWSGSPFYVASESRPWFVGKQASKRIAAINSMGSDGNYAHIILSEEPEQTKRSSNYLQKTPFYLFPIAGENRELLIAKVEELQNTIDNADNLAAVANQTFHKFQQYSHKSYTVGILGRNHQELTRELRAAIKGINLAFEKGEDWQTPLGSYFTAQPLGKQGEIAFVYPAAVNSYIGIGRDLFRLFPKTHDDLAIKSADSVAADVSSMVFPRSLNKLSMRQLEKLEQQLLEDSSAIFETDITFAKLITRIIREDFQIKPRFAFGYSLGETSMMSAIGVWNDFNQAIKSFHSSPLFSNRLSGAKNAVREYWGLPPQKQSLNREQNLWGNYVLMTTPEQLRKFLQYEKYAYLTQINTPEEVIIAGDPKACERVIKTLGCNAFRAPFDHVIHCEAMHSEYGEITRVHRLPVAENISDITLYSSAKYAPIAIESNTIAESIAQGLSQQIDFPKLVNRIYKDGAKIFIETGAGNVCSRWIDKILNNQPHVCVSLNRRGLDDRTGLIKALAKLLSHQISMDLSPLYSQTEETSKKSKLTLRKVTLGGESFTEKILTAENRKLFQNILKKQTVKKQAKSKITQETINTSTIPANKKTQPTPSLSKKQSASPTKLEKSPMNNLSSANTSSKNVSSTIVKAIAKKSEIPSRPIEQKLAHTVKLSNSNKSQYQQLTTNNSLAKKTHRSFLKSRHEFSQQIGDIIQLQLICAEHLLSKE
ncbi:PfaB family protein [Mastigocoleus sp. MO_188.B34]|uniref:PfaB family protein n=1 Tax=Mastigocoleus sp. MO_188.B34 TaxID=3036635 RepID=UPI0026282827|nr:PfaB family protein [Mastigocoleus sp. MO_188.B34]MDJ0692864.1 PfaB family protein [Mastigocoleus sp. MO_188.B34]